MYNSTEFTPFVFAFSQKWCLHVFTCIQITAQQCYLMYIIDQTETNLQSNRRHKHFGWSSINVPLRNGANNNYYRIYIIQGRPRLRQSRCGDARYILSKHRIFVRVCIYILLVIGLISFPDRQLLLLLTILGPHQQDDPPLQQQHNMHTV